MLCNIEKYGVTFLGEGLVHTKSVGRFSGFPKLRRALAEPQGG